MASPTAVGSAPTLVAPVILSLNIERFRGITALTWHPAAGVNVILGGGDVGKTTILDAIALLLAPTNATAVSDTDYYRRDIDAGFVIEAVISLPPSTGISDLTKLAWPWHWDGNDAVVPSMEDNASVMSAPVYRLRVRGTPKHDLSYEIAQPNGTTDICPVDLRRAIGLVRLSGDDRNDRDLRLVQGSALDRLLSDKGLRSRLATGLAQASVTDSLAEKARESLSELDKDFKTRNLPANLDLAITGGPGFAVTALIGLTADRAGVQLPLASWGAGTRRMAALAIAEQNQGETPITIVDEIERDLEPYRQRSLIGNLRARPAQVFVTTHSPAVLAAASETALWYVDHEGKIGSLYAAAKHRTKDPNAFLARLTIVAEGITELGFATALLEKAVGGALDDHGIHVTNGDGHEAALDLLEALATGGLRFGGFADDEKKHPTRWAKLKKSLGPLLFRWTDGCLEENMVRAVPDHRLLDLLTDPADEKTGMRLRALAERLGIEDKAFETIINRVTAQGLLKRLIADAAIGTAPEGKEAEKKHYKGQTRNFFKTAEGGRELAEKLFSLGIWPTVRLQLMPFCNAVRNAVDLPDIEDLAP